MNLKKVVVAISAALVVLGVSAFASDTAVYEINTEIEILEKLTASSRDNWEIIDDSARLRISGETMRINPKSSDPYNVQAWAGEDLYAALSEEEKTRFSFSVEVQADSPIQIEGVMGEKCLFSLVSIGGTEYEKLSADFEISSDDSLAIGSGEAEDFKIIFKGEDNSYVEKLSIRKSVDKKNFVNISSFAGITAGVETGIFATEDTDAKVIISLISLNGETTISTTEKSLNKGFNTVKIDAKIPDDVSEDDIIVLYVTDSFGEIISERKQAIAKFYANGVNIISSDLQVKEALKLFGGGEYLVEFDTDLEMVKTTIGNVSTNSISGICEILLTDEDIASLIDDAVIEFDSEVSNVTLRKVAD